MIIQLNIPPFNEITPTIQSELDSVLKYAEPFHIDCKAWKYGDVKTVQHLLTKTLNEETFTFIIEIALGKYWKSKRYDIVMLTFKGITESIMKISEFEEVAFRSKRSDLKLSAAVEAVGGFEKFNRLPELVSLMEVCHCTYEEAYNMEWNLANSIQWYKHTQNEVQKEYNANTEL